MTTDTIARSRGDGAAGQAALRLIDKLLRERPERVGHDFSEATRCLTEYRDSLIATWRESGVEADRARLAQANAVLSVLVGGHFPLGGVPWAHIEKARNQLAALLHSRTQCTA